MRRKVLPFAVAVMCTWIACGGGNTAFEPQTPPPPPPPASQSNAPTLSSAVPRPTQSGDIGLNLTGSGFQANSIMRWNGADRPTNYLSDTQLSASALASDLSKMGQIRLTVYNPSDSASSNALPLTGSRNLSPTAPLEMARQFHSAALLENQRVFISGGENVEIDPSCDPRYCYYPIINVLGSTEIFDPTSLNFTRGPNLFTPRYSHSSTRLRDGRIFIAGGLAGASVQVSSTEIFDPTTGTITQTASAPVGGGSFAFLLSNGRVLLFAGGTQEQPLTAEIYDPTSDSFSVGGTSAQISDVQTATLLPNDKVLLIGDGQCISRIDCTTPYRFSYVYDATAATFSPAGTMLAGRMRQNAALVQLSGTPKVLVIGGGDPIAYYPHNSTEIFDVQSGKFEAGPGMFSWRISSSATVMADGSVFVLGGSFLPLGCATGPGETWNSMNNTFSIPTESGFNGCGPRLTSLSDGSVLITGGWSDKGVSMATAWIFR